MNIAIIIPSRGTIYAKTVEEITRNLEAANASFSVIWSIGRPIPDCFEIPTLEALEGDYDYVLYIEDDMILPDGIVQEMLDAKKDIVICDYPMGASDSGVIFYDPDMKPFFGGCGLLLVKTSILRKMPLPIWRTDLRWKPHIENGMIHFFVSQDTSPVYGRQDANFGLRLYMNGYETHVIRTTAGQRRTIRKGTRETNDGADVILEKTTIYPRDTLKNIHDAGDFETIYIDGKYVSVRKDMVEKNTALQNKVQHTAGRARFSFPEQFRDWLLFPNRD